jgi:hypothetical protein
MTDHFLLLPTRPVGQLAAEARVNYVEKQLKEDKEWVRKDQTERLLEVMRRGEVTAHQLAEIQSLSKRLFWDPEERRVLTAMKPDLSAVAMLDAQTADQLKRYLTKEGEGIVPREQLREFAAVVDHCLHIVVSAVRDQLERKGISPDRIEAWRLHSRTTLPWETARLASLPTTLVGAGEFMAMCRRAVDAVSASGLDLVIRSIGGSNQPFETDYARLLTALSAKDRDYLFGRLDDLLRKDWPLDRANAEEELRRFDDLGILARMHARTSLNLSDDGETFFGHYLAKRAGLPLTDGRSAGDAFPPPLSRAGLLDLRNALAEVAAGRPDEKVLRSFADEYLVKDEYVRLLMDSFGDEHGEASKVRDRKRLERLVATALEGSKNLFFVHLKD